MKGMADFAVFMLVCISLISIMGILQAVFVANHAFVIHNTLEIYIELDDESSSLVSLMGAEKNGMLFMEMLGYKALPDYVYNVPDIGEVRSAMYLMDKNFNLDLITGTSLTIGTGSNPVCKPVPVDGTCQTDDPGGTVFSWPLQSGQSYTTTSGFGYRAYSGCRCHNGIDIASPKGTSILAAAPGRVIFAGRQSGTGYGGYGNAVAVYHDSGYSTLYGHLDTISVTVGQIVSAGQQVGTMGNTGLTSSGEDPSGDAGTHLHFEVFRGQTRSDETARNPCVFLNPVPEGCIHKNDCGDRDNCGSMTSAEYVTTPVNIPYSTWDEDSIGPAPSRYITEVPLPGAKPGFIKGVVGGMEA